MARELTFVQHPIIEPGVCGKCGTQTSSWFVDLGFDTVFNYVDENGYKTWCDGIVYLCAECCNSFFEDVFRGFNIYKRGEDRELVPLKMIPITLDKKEDLEDGNSGSSDDSDLGDTDSVDSDDSESESDDGDATEAFRVSFAKAV